jgi:hypothetical protein
MEVNQVMHSKPAMQPANSDKAKSAIMNAMSVAGLLESLNMMAGSLQDPSQIAPAAPPAFPAKLGFPADPTMSYVMDKCTQMSSIQNMKTPALNQAFEFNLPQNMKTPAPDQAFEFNLPQNMKTPAPDQAFEFNLPNLPRFCGFCGNRRGEKHLFCSGCGNPYERKDYGCSEVLAL